MKLNFVAALAILFSLTITMVSTEGGILITGGETAFHSIDLYLPNKKSIQHLDYVLNMGRVNHVSVALPNKRILVAGGERFGNTASTEIVDLNAKISTEVRDMLSRRTEAAGALLNGSVYVCGGLIKEYDVENSCEQFNGTLWQKALNMTIVRRDFSMVNIKDKIHAVGGTPQNVPAESFSLATMGWHWAGPMAFPRLQLAATSLNGTLVACGGCEVEMINGSTPTKPLTDCEAYSPKQDKWLRFADMKVARKSFSMVEYGGKIYAIGGKDEHNQVITSIESYDPNTKKWKVEDVELTKGRIGFSAVAVDVNAMQGAGPSFKGSLLLVISVLFGKLFLAEQF